MTDRPRVPELGPIDLGSGPVRLREPSPFDGLAWSRLRVDDADRLAARQEGLVPVDDAVRWAEVNQSVHWMAVHRLALLRIEQGLGFSWVIEYENRFAGQLELTGLTQVPQGAARVGAWVGRQYAGKGVASAALAIALDYAFDAGGLAVVEAVVDKDNAYSRAGLVSMGFRMLPPGEELRSTWESIYPPDPNADIFAITPEDLSPDCESFADHARQEHQRRARHHRDDEQGSGDRS